MIVTDPIADMLTRIRNAVQARHASVLVPASKMKLSMARILKEEGFIRDFEVLQDSPSGTIKIWLKYNNKVSVVAGLKRISKPGRRTYTKRDDIPRVIGGAGICIISTPRGLMTGRKAWQQNLGGEVVCFIW